MDLYSVYLAELLFYGLLLEIHIKGFLLTFLCASVLSLFSGSLPQCVCVQSSSTQPQLFGLLCHGPCGHQAECTQNAD